MNPHFNPTLRAYKKDTQPTQESESQPLPQSNETTAIHFRPYQLDAFLNRSNGLECWLWGRQTGKSFTLAAQSIPTSGFEVIPMPGRLHIPRHCLI